MPCDAESRCTRPPVLTSRVLPDAPAVGESAAWSPADVAAVHTTFEALTGGVLGDVRRGGPLQLRTEWTVMKAVASVPFRGCSEGSSWSEGGRKQSTVSAFLPCFRETGHSRCKEWAARPVYEAFGLCLTYDSRRRAALALRWSTDPTWGSSRAGWWARPHAAPRPAPLVKPGRICATAQAVSEGVVVDGSEGEQ